MALGGGIHVVSDADGLFEETLHTAEVDAAVHKVLHSTEMGRWIRSVPTFAPPARAQQVPGADPVGLPEGSS